MYCLTVELKNSYAANALKRYIFLLINTIDNIENELKNDNIKKWTKKTII